MNDKIIGLFFLALCCTVMVHQASAGIGPQCLLPIERGSCRALMPRYAYNPDTNQCEQFLYGGCPGNENNFENLEQCQQVCS